MFSSRFSSPESKAHWWAYRIGRPLSSVVCLSVRRPHSLNSFSSETAWPIIVKFHMEPPWDGGTKVCSNGPDHMTKMAAMPIYGKNFKNLLLRNQKADELETWYTALGAQVLPSCSNDDPGLTLTYFTARSNLVPYAFVWEKGKIMDLKLATDDRSDKKFLLTSKLYPLETVCSLSRGCIHVLNHEKKNV